MNCLGHTSAALDTGSWNKPSSRRISTDGRQTTVDAPVTSLRISITRSLFLQRIVLDAIIDLIIHPRHILRSLLSVLLEYSNQHSINAGTTIELLLCSKGVRQQEQRSDSLPQSRAEKVTVFH